MDPELANLTALPVAPSSTERLGNGTFRIHAGRRNYFCKSLPASDSARLEAEVIGLQVLRQHSHFHVPSVYGIEKHEGTAFLVLEWLELHQDGDTDWESFGRCLAQMHKVMRPQFGFDHDNFIGTTAQNNSTDSSWFSFFVANRLLFQKDLAQTRGFWRDVWSGLLDNTINRFESMLPAGIAASLCHGDLWSGNCGFSAGRPSIFDPAVYYGHYEVDLAMTLLFGGFPGSFYDSYYEITPAEVGFKDRSDVYNLYHLLNHLNIFGQTYASRVDSSLKRLGA